MTDLTSSDASDGVRVFVPFGIKVSRLEPVATLSFPDAVYRLLGAVLSGSDQLTPSAVRVGQGASLLDSPDGDPIPLVGHLPSDGTPMVLSLRDFPIVRQPNKVTIEVLFPDDRPDLEDALLEGELCVKVLAGAIPGQLEASDLLPGGVQFEGAPSWPGAHPDRARIHPDHPDAADLAGLKPGLQEPPASPLERIAANALAAYRGDVQALLDTMTPENAGQVLGDVTILSGQYKSILDRFNPSKMRLRERGRRGVGSTSRRETMGVVAIREGLALLNKKNKPEALDAELRALGRAKDLHSEGLITDERLESIKQRVDKLLAAHLESELPGEGDEERVEKASELMGGMLDNMEGVGGGMDYIGPPMGFGQDPDIANAMFQAGGEEGY